MFVFQYKARLYVIQRSMKACKREIKVLMDSGDAVSLKSSCMRIESDVVYIN